jgi:hypothetical protein
VEPALDKLVTQVFGYEFYLRTDNTALFALGKCALTANCIDGWVLQIHQYNLNIQHNSGADNFLSDTVSLNPAGLCERDTKELFKPNDGGRYTPKYCQLRGRKS